MHLCINPDRRSQLMILAFRITEKRLALKILDIVYLYIGIGSKAFAFLYDEFIFCLSRYYSLFVHFLLIFIIIFYCLVSVALSDKQRTSPLHYFEVQACLRSETG